MFQYAFGRALALDLGLDLKLDISNFGSDSRPFSLGIYSLTKNIPFGCYLSTSTRLKVKMTKKLRRWGVWGMDKNMPGVLVEPFPPVLVSLDEVLSEKLSHLFVDGYWQSEKYFSRYSDVIRSDFRVIEESSAFLAWKKRMLSEPGGSISVHVRRGDYVTDSSANRVHGVLPIEYYLRAKEILNTISDGLVFYVFTDDPVWARNNLCLGDKTIYVSGEDLKDYEELALMSCCDHHVVANSSFSWWGAWLGQDTSTVTIAPGRWFRKMDSSFVIPDNWIKIWT
ncbi:glycosyl transferase family 11 [Dethiosulfovibrio peptidovorans DSM 11002]|uniref:Glycosyl transferase family 11 n=2 Tax=Dethiosulfovibrio TaxID=47054 RepID=D2Z343_9BACT|nr:glycosyl transferase family 11 [Dethiosulfovibrio peptidovorans DSM 11002]